MAVASALRMLLVAHNEDEHDEDQDPAMVVIYLCVSCVLVIMAGLMSGLTLGLMSLDMVELEVLKRSGTADEKRCAERIMPVVSHQHQLLVTLLICNAAATEALPIFLDRLADPFTAVLVSVSVVLVFGEILPQAVCSRYGLKVGAYSAWFVRALMFVCAPIAWPISKLLDWVLGHGHSALFRRAQLKALVDLHGTQAGFGGTLTEDEIHVIRGALDLTNKTAERSMTPLDKVFMLSTEDRLDERTLQAVLMSGHSRIPVYRGGNRKDIIGLLLCKELVLVEPSDSRPVHELELRDLPRLSATTPMYDMLKLFESGRSHMAVLTRGVAALDDSRRQGMMYFGATWGQPLQKTLAGAQGQAPGGRRPLASVGDLNLAEEEPVGIITIEDVIEELLQEEIIDETDQYVDNLQTSRVNAAVVAGSLPPRLREVLSAGIFTPRVGRFGDIKPFMPPSTHGELPSAASMPAGGPMSHDEKQLLEATGVVALTVQPLAPGKKSKKDGSCEAKLPLLGGIRHPSTDDSSDQTK